jgi:diadenylate cyclase
MPLFITIRALDILDIVLVAILIYQIYRLIKGTVALNIVIGLFSLYLVWLIVKGLKMQLLGSIMGQFIGVGIIALIIVFHPEIRKFLVYIGTNYSVNKVFNLDKVFNTGKPKSITSDQILEIVDACTKMAETKTGAIIVISLESELLEQIATGEKLNARISSALLHSIFFKNAPLHDGAVIIKGNKIVAARCILPITQRDVKNPDFGLRHRAAIGITESTDAISVVVSEERGTISFVREGKVEENISVKQLIARLEKFLTPENQVVP